ncbi:MAG TPA: glycosyltransferase [Phototrophicaceae bacterium]|nr:glycosyltransferase [Phototrophicaceae bacterium]
MRITILTAGTRGDIQPYVALGTGLKRAGYQVRLVGSQDFAAFVTAYGLDFFPMQLSMAAAMNTEGAQAILEAGNPIKGLLLQRKLSQSASPLDQTQLDIWEACQNAEAIIYHPGLANGYYIARHLGIPCLMASAIPMGPTREYPSILFYHGPHLGPVYNRLTHTLFEQVFWQMGRATVKAFWQERGTANTVPLMPPYRRQRDEGVPMLYGYSEKVLPRPVDWPANLQITGYWFLDAAADWQPPAALVDFLQAGPPPVYLGFGSMGNQRRAQENTEIALQALALSGQRGLLVSGWNTLNEAVSLPDTVFMVKDVPHAWLFPQMAAVVHHGGAGTTAAGLRAGIPSVIVPHGVDQPFWGRRVAELGAGSPPIPRKQLTAENLAAAITTALHKDVRTQAEHLGRQIRAEDGIAKAVELVNHYLH